MTKRPPTMHGATGPLALAVVLQSIACSGSPEPAPASEPAPAHAPEPAAPTTQPATPPATPPAAEHAAHEAAAQAAAMPAVPAGAKVSFVAPADGATIKGPLVDGKVSVPVQMGAEGIEVKPAGPIEAGSGHHHILVDTPATAAGSIVPADDKHLHFGKAQTEATLSLAPGEHTLTLQFADGIHRSYGPSLSSTIKVTVAGE